MKSFIRSHRQSNHIDNHTSPPPTNGNNNNTANTAIIVDGNITKASLSRRNSHFDNPLSLISSDNSSENGTLDSFGSPKRPVAQEFNTPPPSIHNVHYSSPSKHSPTFESFQKLANKTHKLFKRASNSNMRSSMEINGGLNYTGSFEHNNKHMSSSSSLPSLDKYNDPNGVPAIKGTITHSWGPSNKRGSIDSIINNINTTNTFDTRTETQVIHLNSDRNENNIYKGSSVANDLKPAVKISMKQDSIIKEHPSEYDENTTTSIPRRGSSARSQQLTDGLNIPKIRARRSSKLQKYKNRQARIHSNEDLINLQSNIENEDEVKSNTRSEKGIKKMTIPSITIQEPTKPDTTIISENNSDDTSDNESETSEFSFEYSGLGGRTSSVKYYSKPEEEEGNLNDEKVYIDDIYEDEDFDENLNYDDDYDFRDVNSNNRDIQSISPNDSSQTVDKTNPQERSVNKYRDLFDTYSEMEEEVEEGNQEFSFNDTTELDSVLIQSENNGAPKLNNYNDLFDITDDDEEEENVFGDDYEDDGPMDEEVNEEVNNNYNVIEEVVSGYNLQHKAENEITALNIEASPQVNEQPLYNTPPEEKGTAAISNDRKKKSGQVQSYSDFFDLSDDDEEDDNYDAPGRENAAEEGNVNKTKQNTSTNTSTDILGQNSYSQDIYNPISNTNYVKNTQQDSVNYRVTDNNNVSKYSDLFDLSDDEDDITGGFDGCDDESESLTQNNSPSNSIPEEYKVRNIPRFNINNTRPPKKSSLSITTNINSQLLSVKPVKKPYIRSYKNFPIISDDYNDENDSENESLTPLTSHLDVASPLDSRHFTPTRNGMLSPTNISVVRTPTHPMSQVFNSQPLPPTARSNILKYHDISSNFDAEVPGLTSNLYFIDEAEEDAYNDTKEEYTSNDDAYNYDLDEINTVPEDFEFSEADMARSKSRNLRNAFGSPLSFRRTHSYHGKPIGVSRENTPVNNRLEISNKTVTFFNQPYSGNSGNNLDVLNFGSIESRTPPSRSPLASPLKTSDDNLKFFSKPSPDYTSNSQYSLSPIQESTSATSSPERH